jgi:hypothetical protein
MQSGESEPGQGARATRGEQGFRSTPQAHAGLAEQPQESGCIAEAVFSPFHCLYQDALDFHTQSHLRLSRSEAEASRLARAAFLLYLSSAEALVHQAACELGCPELSRVICDPQRPLNLADAWRLLPSVVAHSAPGFDDVTTPPWPQFTELLAMRTVWAYPGPESQRRVYYHQRSDGDGSFEPIELHQVPPEIGLTAASLVYPRTGLPRDPYALRPRHLDTARSVLDAAIAALDRRLGGALTLRGRHRREPLRIIYPAP